MKFFRLPQRNRKYLDEETPMQRFIRVLVVLAIFAAVAYFGFWRGSERRMEMLNAPPHVRGAAVDAEYAAAFKAPFA